jgi:hypothetical protein
MEGAPTSVVAAGILVRSQQFADGRRRQWTFNADAPVGVAAQNRAQAQVIAFGQLYGVGPEAVAESLGRVPAVTPAGLDEAIINVLDDRARALTAAEIHDEVVSYVPSATGADVAQALVRLIEGEDLTEFVRAGTGPTYQLASMAEDGPRDLLRHRTLGPMAREDIQRRRSEDSMSLRRDLTRHLTEHGLLEVHQLVALVGLTVGRGDDVSRVQSILMTNPEFLVDSDGRWRVVPWSPEVPLLHQAILQLFPRGDEVLACGVICERLRTGDLWPSDSEVRKALDELIKAGCLIFIHDQHTAGYRLLKRPSPKGRQSALDRLKDGGLDL